MDADGETTTDDDASSTGDEDSSTDPDPGDSFDIPGSGDSGGGGPTECAVTLCQGHLYKCGDCVDNDGDGHTDVADTDCWGPCDNNEGGFKGEVPGQPGPACTQDCYFDQDSGAGNDDCRWSQRCDPEAPMGCDYDPETNVPGSELSCEELDLMQSQACHDFCGPLVPNGCDCFGCCDITKDGEVYTVFLGTENADRIGTCNLENVDDPELCNPCTQVVDCANDCDPDACEICIGQNEVPEGCDEPSCDEGQDSCDPQKGNADCPDGMWCVTGCCVEPIG